MLHPSIGELTANGDNAYSIVIAAAKRAREIANEAKDKEEVLDESPMMLAVRDFADGKTKVKH
ncbi:MAG: DNA-directed RNA polymerase subunit omega [Clostridia bacterium]|nr:DNA-directed RNA polymerase subunit omega [Clostridia bacterium]MBR4439060.1 DNA-directed RNA polymerase subunit omega [Clostridia bacterium]MBR5769601.1 DNA-directed RNA polymerase subunit omega [Clostridia bacterium]MBR5942382.1 DNA-directed RNA polymerase subunit omega [Clostridia bacterium]